MQKVTYYAEEYEIGNINYVQLIVYLSSIRENLNEIMGVVEKSEGGLLKQEQIRNVLGEPEEETKWVWVEKEEQEIKLEHYVPIWKRIVFDGKKIRISLSAHPSLFKKCLEEDKNECEKFIIYRLHFEIEFKRPEEQIDITGKINKIKNLAENFNNDPSKSNAEILAKESVNAEKIFESYLRKSSDKCEDIMKAVFGTENQRQLQKMIVNEISFYEGDNFEAIIRLEMCDDCEWNWIGLNMHLEGRGRGFRMPKEIKEQDESESKQKFKGMSSEDFKTETAKLIEEIKEFLEQGNYNSAISSSNKLNMITNVWNEEANNVWEETDKSFVSQQEILTGEALDNFYRNYGWIKEEQEKRRIEKELREKNYEDRKKFYESLFASYDKKEFYFEQIEFEKRLVETFKEHGKEICDNFEDDNDNGVSDCGDEQCSGKICGEIEVDINDGNSTRTEMKKLYCISGSCQLKEESEEVNETICGNHICEGGETLENCAEDCTLCPEYSPIECSGKVIFSGQDKNGCYLEPVCIEEDKFCESNEDCSQPLCGETECIRLEPKDDLGKCQITELKECQEAICTEGEEKYKTCSSGEQIIESICLNGLWENLDVKCSTEPENITSPEPVPMPIIPLPEPIIGEECTVREDCGGGNDVCSNGKCVTLPEKKESEEEIVIEEESKEEIPEEIPEEEPFEEEQEIESAPEITGEVIFNLFMRMSGKITGFFTGSTIDESTNTEEVIEKIPEQVNGEETAEIFEESSTPLEEEKEDTEEYHEDDYERKDEDKERRKQECSERCERECHDRLISPCVEKCVFDNCGNQLECNIDKITGNCEDSCSKEKSLSNCKDECHEKCLKGEDTWEEPEWEEHKEEMGVFSAGGNCRKEPGGETGGYIWLNGWGDPFEKIQPLKNKYYQGGEAEWCKWDLENLKKERKEIEKGFNQEFADWFFEKYMVNNAEGWEQHMSGIFEMYWRVVDNQMQIMHRMACLEIEEISDYKLINFSYETEYGSVEYWEELKEITPEEFIGNPDGSTKGGKITIISPYMKIWIFPPKEFIIYEMKKSMINHEFPGSPEEKIERRNEEGPTAEERERIKQNERFMRKIRDLSEKYDGNIDVAVEFRDYEKNEVVFNLYGQVNEEDILKIKPMLPEEITEKDIQIELDFEDLYDLIYTSEKEMRGAEIESPPWDKKSRKGGVKNMVDGIKMYFKVRKMMNSAKIYPESAEKDAKELFDLFFKIMKEKDGGEEDSNKKNSEELEPESEMLNSKEKLTGEIVR